VGRRVAYVTAAIAATIILFIAGGQLMLNALERQLIYFPTKVRASAATPRLPVADVVEEVWLETDDEVRVHGIYAGRQDAFATLLFFHGNAGNLYDRLDNVALLVQAGFNVLIMDYRGYGKSEGAPSERALYDDGLLAYRHLVEERGVDPRRLVLFGRSLGSTVAIELGAASSWPSRRSLRPRSWRASITAFCRACCCVRCPTSSTRWPRCRASRRRCSTYTATWMTSCR
jgi:acetyl esterase/lipase